MDSKSSRKRKKGKKKQKLQSSANDIVSGLHLTGLPGGGFPESGATEGDLLDELTALQHSSTGLPGGVLESGANEGDLLDELTALGKEAAPLQPNSHSVPQSPPLDQVPNIRVELARHLHTQNLSKFLLEGSSLRMPSFERWLLE